MWTYCDININFSNTEVLFYKYTEISLFGNTQIPNLGTHMCVFYPIQINIVNHT